MEATGLACVACGRSHDRTATGRCACGGALDATYEGVLDAATFDDGEGLWRFADALPFDADAAVGAGEGDTPLVACPAVAAELGVAAVYVKDEGANPTGALADRGASLVATAALAAGAEELVLPTAGTTGQSVAAYAGRAGLASTAFVPSRAGFVRKAMVNVHGGEMSVVEGRLRDAVAAYEDASADAEWYPARPVESPHYAEGLKTLVYEVAEALDWTAPDAVVHPTGTGAGLAAFSRAATELRDAAVVEGTPALYAAQAEGCAPVVEAVESGDPIEPVEHPDTIAGELEVADPPAGARAVAACRESGGGAVAVPDDEVLESAVRLAAESGVELSVSGGVAAAAAWRLAEDGAFDGDETLVLVNDDAGSKDADVLRSHLMGRGV